MNRNKAAKRVLAGMMSAAMLAAMPVYADNTGNNDHIIVTYSQNTTYMLSIPASITLSSTDTAQATDIGVSAVNTTPTEKVQVTITSGITNYQVELERDGDSETTVVSEVTDGLGNPVSIGSVIAEFKDMSTVPITAGTGVLNFSKVKDGADETAAVKAGSYSGTIVFEGKVVNRN